MIIPARLAAVALLLALAGLAHAQQPADPLAGPRSRDALTDDDRTAIRNFVRERLTAIASDDGAGAGDAVAQFRTGQTGTNAFKEAYAAATIEIIGPAYKKAKPLPAARLIALLASLNAADAHPLFIEALSDPRVGVRAAAAAGLRMLHAKLAAAGSEFTGRVLTALRDAGKKETARETLAEIYRAMNYAELPTPPDLRSTTTALLELLEARAAALATEQAPAAGADAVGVHVAGLLIRTMDDAEKARYTKVLARLMQWAMQAYTSGERPLAKVREGAGVQIELRDAVERLIDDGEAQLLTLVAPQGTKPAVAERMKKAEITEMKLQWKTWVALLKPKTGEDYSLREDAGSE